ncbi:hypothetical protein BBJ28_00002164 [Nothophytophthora sp. Chile5]|nr:hypothetical protein BBJ28_00002164 [Nothophytophthora sp. Chile5]
MRFDPAAQRTLRFVLGPRDDRASAPALANDQHSPIATSEPKSKRRRVAEASVVEVQLVELIRDLDRANDDNDKHYGLFVWPSALLLARFVAQQASTVCQDKVVLELGCGTGLPSILAGLCGRPAKVLLTDRADAVDIQRNVEANIRLNNLEGLVEFLPLTWGDVHLSDRMMETFRTVGVVLAADCFYQSEGSASSVHCVLLNNSLTKRFCHVLGCRFRESARYGGSHFPLQCLKFVQVLLHLPAPKVSRFPILTIIEAGPTFSLRLPVRCSINRSIAALLSRWGLAAKALDKRQLLGNEGDCEVQLEADFDSVYLYEIWALDAPQ